MLEHDSSSSVTVADLVHHFDLEVCKLVCRLLEHLAQILHRQLKILLNVFEDLGLVVPLEVVGESVRPFEGLAALLQALRGIVDKLYFDPILWR